ncbi:Modin [Pleurostoma richardsiae]|uniref:Modin n=1 Tax=Pleurostoma richardsiae TaxID=41990 RepID=A0AA38RQC8_9PEZI|nr:Modin [Pleurostoma richardsiae]
MADNSTSSGSGNYNGNGNDTVSNVVAIVALVISVIAFMATILQVLQQYYASAAGYSNCGEKVMGEWHRTKRRIFRWDEFRFEVQFEAPVIFVCPPNNKSGPIAGKSILFINGTEESLVETRTLLPREDAKQKANASPEDRIHTADNERATWVTLLSALQSMEKDSRDWQQREFNHQPPHKPLASWDMHTLAAALQPKLRSWDTMPSNVKKPYATTAMCHMIEIAAMLGLHWKEFDRSRDKYHAEGNGFTLTGQSVADLGIMFTFQIHGKSKFEENRVIPVDEVKEFAFGFVSTIFRDNTDKRRLEFPNEEPKDMSVLQLGSSNEIAETLTLLSCNTTTSNYFRDDRKKQGHIFPIAFEILGMLSQTLHIPSSCYRMLPNPTKYGWNKKSFSLRKLLLEYNRFMMNDDLVTVQNGHTSLLQNWGGNVAEAIRARGSEHEFPLSLLDTLHEALDNCDAYLRTKVNRELVVLVLREHLQEVLRLLNERDAFEEPHANSGTDDSGSSKDGDGGTERPRTTFEDLDSASPEEKQAKFMDIYFAVVLPHVVRNSAEVLKKRKSTFYVQHSHNVSNASSSGNLHADAANSNNGAAPHSGSNNLAATPPHHPPLVQIQKPAAADDPAGVHARLRRMETGLHDEKTTNIWCTLVFRMLCWLLLHDFHKKDVQISKSELLGSRLPVYIS